MTAPTTTLPDLGSLEGELRTLDAEISTVEGQLAERRRAGRRVDIHRADLARLHVARDELAHAISQLADLTWPSAAR